MEGYQVQQKIVYTAGIETQEQSEAIKNLLTEMIGVYQVDIDINSGNITIEFETPANLNSIEKEIYDAGYKVLY
ncbi:putative copper chaperone CsoZ [Staphylococcus warneri]|uniref:putative copper chaperone CsoZ n=1 Tax=Staphylococcus warneri TaxID=1292 RepID=UPI001E3AAC30|nr:heavy metal-associated domain-containing protein [Staphylococcus warneri]